MPVSVLVHAFTHSKALKGTPSECQDVGVGESGNWGAAQGLPNYGNLVITDRTKSEIAYIHEPWVNEISFEQQNGGGQGVQRYRISIHPKVIAEFGLDAGLKDEMQEVIIDAYGGTIVSWTPSGSNGIFQVPDTTDYADFESDIKEKFEEAASDKHYYFAEADVNAILASPDGVKFEDSTESLARLVDRLD